MKEYQEWVEHETFMGATVLRASLAFREFILGNTNGHNHHPDEGPDASTASSEAIPSMDRTS